MITRKREFKRPVKNVTKSKASRTLIPWPPFTSPNLTSPSTTSHSNIRCFVAVWFAAYHCSHECDYWQCNFLTFEVCRAETMSWWFRGFLVHLTASQCCWWLAVVLGWYGEVFDCIVWQISVINHLAYVDHFTLNPCHLQTESQDVMLHRNGSIALLWTSRPCNQWIESIETLATLIHADLVIGCVDFTTNMAVCGYFEVLLRGAYVFGGLRGKRGGD